MTYILLGVIGVLLLALGLTLYTFYVFAKEMLWRP